MQVYALYENGKCDDAIIAADRFIQLHPGHKDVAYAYYLKAICYYMQIVDVGRDQKLTELALKSLDDIVRRFPDSKYARDAKLKLDFTRDHLAGKEMEIGRYYLKSGGAIGCGGGCCPSGSACCFRPEGRFRPTPPPREAPLGSLASSSRPDIRR